jgi:hypothetical protein
MSTRVTFLCVLISAFGLTSATASGGIELEDLFDEDRAPWLSRNAPGETRRENETAGEQEHLETDRDSFTPSTTTVGTGRLVLESAYSFINNKTTADSHSFPEIVTRYGLTDRLELRFGWNYELGGGGSVSSGDSGGEFEGGSSEQESQILYGIKYSLTDQDSWLPQGAAIIQGVTPTSGPSNTSDLQLGYVFGWKFFDDWQLDSSIRRITTQDAGDHFNQWAPSVVLKVPLAERWNIHGEYFGIFTDGRSNETNGQYFSPGIHYLFSPNFEFGVRVGWGLNNDAANSFTNVGFGIRL